MAGQELVVSGGEVRIRAKLSFRPIEPCDSSRPIGSSDKSIPRALATFTLERILPAPAGLMLRRTWTPRSDAKLEYELDNGSKLEWFGTGNMANFFGRVEAFQDGAWVPYVRGGMCGTDSSGEVLLPGKKTQSIEGHFLTDVRPFQPGRYRYVIDVARELRFESYSCIFAASGAPSLHRWDTYERSDEFSIER